MTANKDPQTLQNLIKYYFADQDILKEALTRRASQSDLQLPLEENMDPLSTLGDAVLDVVVIQRFYEKDIREKGKLTELKINQTNREKTQSFAERYHFHEFVQWGKGEDQDEIWTKGDKVLDTVTEALIGAIYLDAQNRGCNGMKVVREMLERMDFFDSKK
jgi:ribonuclease III